MRCGLRGPLPRLAHSAVDDEALDDLAAGRGVGDRVDVLRASHARKRRAPAPGARDADLAQIEAARRAGAHVPSRPRASTSASLRLGTSSSDPFSAQEPLGWPSGGGWCTRRGSAGERHGARGTDARAQSRARQALASVCAERAPKQRHRPGACARGGLRGFSRRHEPAKDHLARSSLLPLALALALACGGGNDNLPPPPPPPAPRRRPSPPGRQRAPAASASAAPTAPPPRRRPCSSSRATRARIRAAPHADGEDRRARRRSR